MKFFCFSMLLSIVVVRAVAQQKNTDYLNQPLPAGFPVLFAEGLVSDGNSNRDMAIAPDGNEIFYTLQHRNGLLSVLLHCWRSGNGWEGPEVATFSGVYGDLEPAFSADGNTLFFTSNRPLSGSGDVKDYDIWYVKRHGSGWGEPVNMGKPVNSPKNEFYPSLARNGNLYFTREQENGKGSEDIVVCYVQNGMYQEAVSLSDSINSSFDEFNAFVDPDEQFIIYSVYGKPGDAGGGDLYISFKRENGEWGKSLPIPAPVNSAALDYCPYVSPDKQFFFFTSNRANFKQPLHPKVDFKTLKSLLAAPGNGFDDIYWMKMDVLKQLKK